MGTDTAPEMENLKLCRFHPKRDIFWISVTISEIWRYVSASVTGCWGFCEWAKMAHCHFEFFKARLANLWGDKRNNLFY